MSDMEFKVTVALTTSVPFSDVTDVTDQDVLDAFMGYGLDGLLKSGEYALEGQPTIVRLS